jgi:hypothetical protein
MIYGWGAFSSRRRSPAVDVMVFWVVMLYSIVVEYHRVKMERSWSSEMLAS